MGIVIGIDVGISTTKIVGLRDKQVISPIRITAADQVTSLYGAFGKYLHDNKIALSDVEQVMLTGVGAAYIDEPVYGIPTQKVDEFIADGLGARFESGLTKAIVVSMGTGTSFVQCEGDDIRHIGGIGIGGGTLQGLSRVMLNTRDPKQIQSLALQGDIHNINLLIGDISTHPLPGTADGRYGIPVFQGAVRCAERRRGAGYHRHGTADDRFCRHLVSAQLRYQRLRADRQSYPVATMQGHLPDAGKAL